MTATASAAVPATFGFGGSLAVITGQGHWPCPVTGHIISVRAAVGTAPIGASILVDVNKNGTTIFTSQGARPSIAAAATSSSAATPAVTAISAGDVLSVDIDQTGSTTAGSDLVVVVLVKGA